MVQFLPDERQTKTTSQDFYDIGIVLNKKYFLREIFTNQRF